ncbi:glycoside hydrolase family 10 protein [Apibacter sp. HY039]|uniref:glycoside hydrolase family 10 protein n=1 Tax=Apibacter sp. HY039 TaxID=2501476 RepID=UPI000FEB61A4|nr:family 10 glycosylhydrolase [Apibacter sp. HY039]
MRDVKFKLILTLLIIANFVSGQPKQTVNSTDVNLNKEVKEFRGVWVASFLNIDWPTKTGLSAEQQKKEFLTILDNVQKWNMNAIVLQVKPTSDAFYKSKLSPWSRYLSGKQGVDPGYDPLEFIITEAHKRNIEIHAWFNPFRLSAKNADLNVLSIDNIAFKHPNWVVRYANQLYLNPGIPEVSTHVIECIMEVVKNYNIDGVHLDDYFYPYKVGNLEYPDYKEYAKYGITFASKADWRRNNINTFVKKLYKSIKSENKNIEFGISPFGVWRNQTNDPRGSDTKALQNYDDLYADVLYWMQNGWIDYIAPQLYWHRGNTSADYSTLIEWWNNVAKLTHTKLYIGLAAYRVNEWKNPDELIEQVKLNKNYPEVKGNIFFSYKSLVTNPKGVLDNLISGPFSK